MSIPEDWEQDFTGLEKWVTVDKNDLKDYLKIAGELEIKLAYEIKNKNVVLFSERDQDMTEFWKKLKELKQ